MSLKVLHILSGLDQGGIEKWLVNLTAELQRQHGCEVESEFMTLLKSGGHYQSTLKTMGCRVHHCQLAWRNLPGFVWRLAGHLRRGRYDVVHCHADYLSGLILPVAHAIGIHTRICHVHNTQFAFQSRRPLTRHLVGRLLRQLAIRDGSFCIGTSSAAIESFLGSLKSRARHRIFACGIPCADYEAALNSDKQRIRQTLNWPDEAKVVLHVGRHTEQKNMFFLLEIFAYMFRREPNAIYVLAGSGPLTDELQAKAKALGIGEKVRFLGGRDDVPQLMRAADLFVLPSLYEGLGLVVIEAQAVGLPSLIADVLPPEVELVKNLVHRLPLNQSPEMWAEQALELLSRPALDAEAGLATVEASPFNITNSAKSLMNIYAGRQPKP